MNKEETFKKFEELGYEIHEERNKIQLINEEENTELVISLKYKFYYKCDRRDIDYEIITLEEHRLLHQLFYALGWLNYE